MLVCITSSELKVLIRIYEGICIYRTGGLADFLNDLAVGKSNRTGRKADR